MNNDSPTHICEWCGTSFVPKGHANRPGRFCKPECYNASGRPKRKKNIEHRTERIPAHPVAPPSGIVSISRRVLYDKIGPGQHLCHWCKKTVQWMVGIGLHKNALIVDHLNHDATDDSPENLVPSCDSCNKRRTRKGEFRPIIKDDELFVIAKNGNRTRAVERICQRKSCGKSFLIAAAQIASKPNTGRFCSLDCMYNRNR
jgi:hypothetical protein